MIVYHGSTVEIKSPDLSHTKRFLDFGPAFYVTSFSEQAEHWARRKHSRAIGVYRSQSLYDMAKCHITNKNAN